MQTLEPPNSDFDEERPYFFIGQNRRGSWIVQDQSHLHGGLFTNQEQARKFALSENGNRPEDLVFIPEFVDLDLRPAAAEDRTRTDT